MWKRHKDEHVTKPNEKQVENALKKHKDMHFYTLTQAQVCTHRYTLKNRGNAVLLAGFGVIAFSLGPVGLWASDPESSGSFLLSGFYRLIHKQLSHGDSLPFS